MTPFESGFIRHNPRYPHVLAYIREALNVDRITYPDITLGNLRKIRDHLLTKVTANTARNYCAVLLAYINILAEDGIIPPKDYTKTMRIKPQPTQSIYLTEEELSRIQAYYERILRTQGHQATKDVLTIFLAESVCGARISDVVRLTADNIHDGILTYTSQKTSTLTRLPAHYLLADLVKRIPAKQYPQSTISRVLKRVGKECGICEPITLFRRGKQTTLPKYEYLSSHIGRKSFCTNLAKRGVDIYSIAAFAGHNNIGVTSTRYIVKDNIEASPEAMAFFSAK